MSSTKHPASGPAVATLCLVLAGCGPAAEETAVTDTDVATADAAGDEAAARAFAECWDPTWMSADADAMAALFTEDGVRLVADGSLQQGREAIRAAFAETFAAATPVTSSNPVSDLAVAGDWAWAWGTFTVTDRDNESGEESSESGRWLSILRRTGDGWRYQVDAWNHDTPYEGEAEPLASHALSSGEGRMTGPSADVEAVEAMILGLEEAAEAGDVDAHLSRFAEDAVRLNDRGSADLGVEAIRATFEAEPRAQEADVVIDVLEVEGDWAWVRGRWGVSVVGPGDSTTHDMGKWISVAHRTPEGWKVKAELWNRDQPFSEPATEP